MKPKGFPQANAILAKESEDFMRLPAFRGQVDKETTIDEVVTCYSLTDEEMAVIQKTKVIWFRQLVGNQALQPQRPQVENPFLEATP